jgi:acyl-CoA thioester hydrolase
VIRIFELEIEVTPSAIDVQGHVNNVAFVQWMQDVAIRHSDAAGCTAATTAAGALWVARSHHIEYLRPAFLGDRVKAMTWITSTRKASSVRRYQFKRVADGVVLAKAETNWVFVERATGRPRSIPAEIAALFELVAEDQEP